jgi:hypothetical protein
MNRRLTARFLRKKFSSKIGHLKSKRRRVDDTNDLLSNIRSSIVAHVNGASTMVTAKLERHSPVANADTGDRAGVSEIPGLAGGTALSAGNDGKTRQVNHADAPHDVPCCSGTDLAQWTLRENCA